MLFRSLMPKIEKICFSIFYLLYFFFNSNFNLKFCVELCIAIEKSYVKYEENLSMKFRFIQSLKKTTLKPVGCSSFERVKEQRRRERFTSDSHTCDTSAHMIALRPVIVVFSKFKDVGYPASFHGGKFKIYRRFPVKPLFYV